MINITHIKWSPPKRIGVALHKLTPGDNVIQITAKNAQGELLYPNPFTVDMEKIIDLYGVTTINKKDLRGVWIPLADVERGYFETYSVADLVN